jgi:hypothetical protein
MAKPAEGRVPAFQVLRGLQEDVDGRDKRRKRGHDDVKQPESSTAVTGLALQLRFSSDMSAPCFGLMRASPERPSDDSCRLDAPLSQLDCDTTDFLNRPADQERCLVGGRSIVFLGSATTLAR